MFDTLISIYITLQYYVLNCSPEDSLLCNKRPFLVPYLYFFSDSRLVCEGIYRVTQNVKSVISCQYESSFHAVRWYFNGNEESFLRIDRINKYGSGYDSGEFDIKSDGSMIINNPEIRNEGTYTISVLHGDGRSSKADMEVNIIGK